MSWLADEYHQKALEAEERAKETTDPDIKARWLGLAFGYRELARYRRRKDPEPAVSGPVSETPLPDQPAPVSSPQN